MSGRLNVVSAMHITLQEYSYNGAIILTERGDWHGYP